MPLAVEIYAPRLSGTKTAWIYAPRPPGKQQNKLPGSTRPRLTGKSDPPGDPQTNSKEVCRKQAAPSLAEKAPPETSSLLSEVHAEDREAAPEAEASGSKGALFKAIVFGIINGIIILPVMIGFAQIIFRHKFFEPYIGSLTKLVLFSRYVRHTIVSSSSSCSKTSCSKSFPNIHIAYP